MIDNILKSQTIFNAAGQSAIEVGQRDDRTDAVIYLPLPKIHPATIKRPMITFNTLAGNRPPEVVGMVEDQTEFSRSLGWDEKAPKAELYIKAPATGFYIPPEYVQFVPALTKIISHYYSQFGDDGYCAIGVLQTRAEPVPDTSRPFVEAHKDISPSCLKEDGEAPNHFVCVVSDVDALQTGFTDYEYSEDDLRKIRESDDPDKAQHDILNQNHINYKSVGSAYTIVAMDSTSPHAIANPTTPVKRTALIVAFTGPEMKAPVGLFNPFLERAVDCHKLLQATLTASPAGR